MSYLTTVVQPHLRLTILRALAQEPNRTCNDSTLVDVAKIYGIDRGRDLVRQEIRWLEGLGAVRVQEVGGTLIVTALERGVDHAEGRVVLEGVRRPSPER